MSQWVPHKGRRVVPILQDWVATAEWHAAHSRWSRLGSCFAFLGFKPKNPIFRCFVLIFWCFFGFRSFFCFDLLMSWVFWVQIFKKTQDSLQHQPGVTDILLVTKAAVAWPKGFWYGVFFTITTRTRDTIPGNPSASTSTIQYQSIGEAFAHGTELVWELLQALKSRGCTQQIRSPRDLHLGCFLICWLFFFQPWFFYCQIDLTDEHISQWSGDSVCWYCYCHNAAMPCQECCRAHAVAWSRITTSSTPMGTQQDDAQGPGSWSWYFVVMPDARWWCQMPDARWLHFFLGITTWSGPKQHDASAIVNDLWFFSFNHGCFLLLGNWLLQVVLDFCTALTVWNDQNFGASIWEAGNLAKTASVLDFCTALTVWNDQNFGASIWEAGILAKTASVLDFCTALTENQSTLVLPFGKLEFWWKPPQPSSMPRTFKNCVNPSGVFSGVYSAMSDV